MLVQALVHWASRWSYAYQKILGEGYRQVIPYLVLKLDQLPTLFLNFVSATMFLNFVPA